MKRIIRILFAVLILTLAASLLVKPAIIILVKSQLKKIFIDSEVSIGGCSLKPARQLILSDIEIKRNTIYALKIREAGIKYDFISLFRKVIPEFYLKDASVSVNLPQKNILKLKSLLNIGPEGTVLARFLELSNLQLDLKSKDLNLKAKLSFRLNLINQSIDALDVEVASLSSQGLQLEDAIMNVHQNSLPGNFYIKQIKYNELKIKEIKSRVKLDKESLFLDSLSSEILDGEIKGDLNLKIGKDLEYFVNLKVVNLDLARFVDDFKLKERVQMSGKLEGAVVLSGKGLEIKVLNGGFSTISPGGMLAVRDGKLLENISRNSGQSLEIIVESFKNYRYNTGTMKLYLDKGNLIYEVALDGEEGKRNLNITVHDFKLKREGL
jgi:hypothetical protein